MHFEAVILNTIRLDTFPMLCFLIHKYINSENRDQFLNQYTNRKINVREIKLNCAQMYIALAKNYKYFLAKFCKCRKYS